MRIIQVMGMRSQKCGGMERFMLEMSKQLKEKTHNLTLIYEEYPLSDVYVKQLIENEVSIIVRPCRGSNLFSFSLFFLNYLTKYRPEIVHVHFDPAGYIALFISKLFGVKKRIKTVHSLLGIGNIQLSVKTKILKHMMAASCSDIFTVSNAINIEYKNNINCNNKLNTLYLGVSSEKIQKPELKLQYNIQSDKIVISCVAFHGHIKGVDILLYAIEHLLYHYKFSNFICLQIGGGNIEYLEYLQTLAEDLKITEYICWLGLRDNVPELLSGSDIYVQPSRSEGISLSLMEASMQELPLIATNVGGIPEVVIDGLNGYLVNVEDSTAMADKIYYLCNNEESRLNMGAKAREFAMEKFDISNNVKKLIDEYDIV